MTTEETARRAPAVELTAIGHGRKVRINELGAPAVLIFLGRETSDQAQPVTRAIRDRYPEASQAVIATITDVRGIPKLVRKVAQTLMKNGYNRAVENLQPGRSPEEYVLILPDWDGEVYAPLGIEDVSKTIAIGVLSASGAVVGTYQGDDPAAHALELLERASLSADR